MAKGVPVKNIVIVGQGLAGTCLALHLIDQGIIPTIIDNSHDMSSSTVSAGLIDPLFGSRFRSVWEFDTSFSYALTFYDECLDTFRKSGSRVPSDKSYVTLCNAQRYPDKLLTKKQQKKAQPFLEDGGLSMLASHSMSGRSTPKSPISGRIGPDSFSKEGGTSESPVPGRFPDRVQTTHSATLDVARFLTDARAYFDHLGILESRFFDAEQALSPACKANYELGQAKEGAQEREHAGACRHKSEHAETSAQTEPVGLAPKGINQQSTYVFCDGWQSVSNPTFSWLPWYCTYGEIAEIEGELPFEKEFIHFFNHWLLFSKTGWLFGSNYIPVTSVGAIKNHVPNLCVDAIEDIWDAFWKANIESTGGNLKPNVFSKRRGVRPTLKDAKPIIGQHPQHQHIWIFNGLGSKGSLYAPWLGSLTTRAMLENKEIPEKISATRYYSFYAH